MPDDDWKALTKRQRQHWAHWVNQIARHHRSPSPPEAVAPAPVPRPEVPNGSANTLSSSSSSSSPFGLGERLVEVTAGVLCCESQSSQPPNALGEDQPGLPDLSQPPNAPGEDQPGLPKKRPQRDTRPPRRYPEPEGRCAFVSLAQEEPVPQQPPVASVCIPAPSWVGLQPPPGFTSPPPGDQPLRVITGVLPVNPAIRGKSVIGSNLLGSATASAVGARAFAGCLRSGWFPGASSFGHALGPFQTAPSSSQFHVLLDSTKRTTVDPSRFLPSGHVVVVRCSPGTV